MIPAVIAVIWEVLKELDAASDAYPPFPSVQHGYGVLLEELEELRDEIRIKDHLRDRAAMRREAVQVAAMAIRFVLDLTEERGNEVI